jgi:peptidyl-prolyl cis-trans isomerase B (cyclophilin B)
MRKTQIQILLTLIVCLFAFACSSEPKGTGTASPSPSSSTPAPAAAAVPPLTADDEIAVIETDYGKIKIRFYPDVAPRHVEHFKKLAREGFYDGLGFHRALPGLIIQGGDPTTRSDDSSRWGAGEPGQETVPAEFNTRPFVRGTVGAARKGNDVNSATSQFFLCLRENPGWNGQYTVYGEVIQGLATVDAISKLPVADEQTGKMREKVVMNRVTIEKAGALAQK